MKKLLSTLFLALVASVGAIYASDTEVNGIWYDFDEYYKTATVTYRGSSYDSYDNEYSGSVVIPASVTYKGITYSVTSIGGGAFYECYSLTSITIPNSVTSISNDAFNGCSSLTSITIPNSVTYIERRAFYNCYSLTSVTIGNSVTRISEEAFMNCYSLTSVTIGNSVTYIGIRAFDGCSSLTSITIPNSVTSIGWKAFSGCSSLTSVTIPNSVTSIGDHAFYECSSLTSIHVDSNNPNYSSVDGVLFNKDKTTLVVYPGGKQGAYTIPNSVTSIGDYAFYECTGLTSVTIGNSVIRIGEKAFWGCKSLTSVTIGNSVIRIGESAFAWCNSLTSVTNYATQPQVISPSVFSAVYLSACQLYVPSTSVGLYQTAVVWKEFGDIQPIRAEDVEVLSDEVQSTKVVKDGQVLILRNGKTYTMQGQEVK